jgi:hypothetical protein
VTGVPTFLVANRHVVPGAQPPEFWSRVIDDILAQVRAQGDMTDLPAAARGRRLSQGEFVAMIAVLFATIAFSIDAMLPALPEIAAELTPDAVNRAQLVLTTFVLGMGRGTLIAGPISDAVGRKPAITAFVGLYVAGAVMAALSGHDRDAARRAARPGDRRGGAEDHLDGARPRHVRGARHGADHVLRDDGLRDDPLGRAPRSARSSSRASAGAASSGLRALRDRGGALAEPAAGGDPARDAAAPARGRSL